MTEKRFRNNGSMIFDNENPMNTIGIVELLNTQHEELENRKRIIKTITNEYNELEQAKNSLLKENEQLKQYKQAVSDVLLSYNHKNLSAKQLGLLTAIMHELGMLE